MKRATVLVCAVIGISVQSCITNSAPPNPAIAFNNAGKIVKVDIQKDEIYLDTSRQHRGSDVYVKNALVKSPTIPKRGDSMFFRVDSSNMKIDSFSFSIKKKK